MFHTARALIFKKGYRERSHYCLIVAVKELYISTNEISPDFAEKLEDGKSKREQADYGLTYYPTSAEESIKDAEKFIEKCDEIL